MSSTLRLADTPNSVTWARRHVVDVLRDRKEYPEEVVEAVRLVVSELVTNAIRHPGPEAGGALSYADLESVGTIELVLEVTGSVVRVAVWDRDPAPPLLKEVGVEATGGRGLFLVAHMSARWGHYACRTGQGKVVWAEVALPAAVDIEDREDCALAFPEKCAAPVNVIDRIADPGHATSSATPQQTTCSTRTPVTAP